MSNLLQPKKKLLNRGPKIEPAKTFSLKEVEKVAEQPQEEPKKVGRPRTVTEEITSVRISKSTRSKLNALVQMGKASNADMMINELIEQYVSSSLTDDDSRIFNIISETLNNRA
ncbi:MAG: DUF5388 domain-containing protein [Caryophanon sp.]|nr:DUF5388 domain-containing protein [Caryophanon sp.]